MKILYAIQGTGNGHLARAGDIVPILRKYHDVDILVSGTQADIKVSFNIDYKYNGLGFIFGQKGGVDFKKTYEKNNLKELFFELESLPVQLYDLVINDFEPVSAWACYLQNINCISLSHQAAVLNKNAPQPKDFDLLGKTILKNYAPSSAQYGFHFKSYDTNLFTPVIRKEVREYPIGNSGHYTVYLPAYNDERIYNVLKKSVNVKWEVFSKHNRRTFREKNISFQPINNDAFIQSLATSEGVLCGAGFETPAEALFMNKKLMVIPMKGQYEQQCNAAALKEMGVAVIKSLKPERIESINEWIESSFKVEVNYPDTTEDIILNLLAKHRSGNDSTLQQAEKKEVTAKKFRKMILKKLTENLDLSKK